MLIFVRHGETKKNTLKVTPQRDDTPLNKNGKDQAKQTAQLLSKTKIDLIFCSPLLRAKQTCKEINKYHNAKIIYDDRIIEREYGIYAGKKYPDDVRYKFWNYLEKVNYENAENISDLFSRIYKFIDEIKLKYKDKNVLVVSHGGVGRVFHCYFNGIPQNGELVSLLIKNAEAKEYNLA